VLDVFRLCHSVEAAAQFLTFILVGAVVILSLVIALTFTKVGAEQRWVSAAPLVNWLVTTAAVGFLVAQIDVYAVIIQRLAQLSGAMDSVAHLHAALFLLLVIATAARAFFVIGEMDKGRYAGRQNVPVEVAKCKWLKWLEATIRLLIIIGLTLFAAAFIKVITPTTLPDFGVIGRPSAIADISRQCAEYQELIARVGFGASSQQCIMDALAELQKGDTLELATAVARPLMFLLPATYVLMMLWCGVVWLAASKSIDDATWLRRALMRQMWIAGLSLCSLVIMLTWIFIATTGAIPLLGVYGGGESLGVTLTWVSIIGACTTTAAYVVLALRLGSDFRTLSHLLQRRKTERSSEGV
jgi:hypothetical protein